MKYSIVPFCLQSLTSIQVSRSDTVTVQCSCQTMSCSCQTMHYTLPSNVNYYFHFSLIDTYVRTGSNFDFCEIPYTLDHIRQLGYQSLLEKNNPTEMHVMHRDWIVRHAV
jgi:hypothetical protein